MKVEEYVSYDGLGLAELVKAKKVSPEELVNLAISQIDKCNPSLNAVIHTIYDRAKTSAKDNIEGPFAGVPMLLKDFSQELKGEPISGGSRALRTYRSTSDSEYVTRLRKSGFLFLGQTNVPELAILAYTEPVEYGPTRNPWNRDHTPGGSSGGSGAAVASGMVPIAGANDGGGSIRIPAAYCGLFGLKPTRGRTPVGPQNGRFLHGAAVEHVLTRTVRDSAAVLDELNGFEKGAAFTVLPFDESYLQTMERPLDKKRKIAFSIKSPIGTEVNAACIEAVMKTVHFLESSGFHVEDVDAPVDGKKVAKGFLTTYFAEISASIARMEEVLGRKASYRDMEPQTWLMGLMGKEITAQEFVLSMREWDIAAYAMESFHEDYDFYITPTTAFTPARIGEHELKRVEKLALQITGKMGKAGFLKKMGLVDQMVEDAFKRVPFTQLANLTGQPAMSVPLHVTEDGLPVGVQFMAARGREDLLLQMASFLEKSDLWESVPKKCMI
ncbi:amidase [Bacillus tianshenii]|uniref:Amidase n=1 Tax=Sutcliffiella tianshenii TaxID=1463404 RepID=A0ABS2NY83_9BACI|nr:amidase family protein [Bacillus tianshenii]MBM7619630.1 amidase [Bacillus tianshenii]